MMITELIIASLIAYLIGSISSAVLVCKLFGLPDPRTKGSRNPGASNVLRIGGKAAAAITLIGDVLKGFVPVMVAIALALDPLIIAVVAFAAVLGHFFPIFFGFVGGKGVATALGALLALAWPAGLAWLFIWLVVAVPFRYASLASMSAMLLTPFLVYYFTRDFTFTVGFAMIAVVIIIRHASNIRNLMAGKEAKIGGN